MIRTLEGRHRVIPNVPLDQLVFTALDLETTGLGNNARIVEVGAVKFTLGSARPLSEFSSLVNPGVPIPESASVIHGITDAQVRTAPKIEDLLPVLERYLSKAIVVGHNIDFDGKVLADEAVRHSVGLGILERPVVDTLSLARRTMPGLESYELGAIVEHQDAHRALPDARAAMRLFRKLVRRLERRKRATLHELVQ